MFEIEPFTAYNLAIGFITGLGILYFLFFKETIVNYHRSLFSTIAGLLLFLVGGPITEISVPEVVHWVHGVASFLVIVGLYDPLKNELRHDVWSEVLLENPGQVRQPAEWMLPIDDAILRLFHTTDLVLTPSIMAYNIGYSRDEVNRRLVELEQRSFVEKVERGKYQITALGKQYVEGEMRYGITGWLRYLWQSGST